MTDVTFFFSGWEPLVRIVIVGIAMYVALVVFLRISRSRTLSSMNAFDFIVTVAIGSAFGRALTAKAVALAETVVAFGLLVALQSSRGSRSGGPSSSVLSRIRQRCSTSGASSSTTSCDVSG
jgi:hypothetical protein